MESQESNSNIVEHIRQFLAYPFDTDQVYQQGLAGILNSADIAQKTEDEKANILLSSRLFYFQRVTGLSLLIEDVQNYKEVLPLSSANYSTPPVEHAKLSFVTSGDEPDEPRALSFAELKELIEQGKTDQIPNNRKIPDVLNQDKASESKAPIRKKPWESLSDAVGATSTTAET